MLSVYVQLTVCMRTPMEHKLLRHPTALAGNCKVNIETKLSSKYSLFANKAYDKLLKLIEDDAESEGYISRWFRATAHAALH